MSNKPVTPHFKRPGYTADTDVEIDGSGAIDPLMPVPQRRLTKLGTFVFSSTQIYRDTAFDLKREDEFIGSQEALETVGDTLAGATAELEETSLPTNAKYVPGAADNLLENRETFTEKCPVAAAAVDWEELAEARGRLKKIVRRKNFTAQRMENLEIAEAHAVTAMQRILDAAFNSAASTIDNSRALTATFKPFTQMVRGAAAEGQETRRAVARALKKQGQKTLAIIPVKDAAAAPADPAADPAKATKP